MTGPEGAALSIDGRPAGLLPLSTPLEMDPGAYLVRCELAGHEPFEMKVTVGDSRSLSHVDASLDPLTRQTAVTRGIVFAGLGQRYLGRPLLGWTLSALEAGGLVTWFLGDQSLRGRRNDYAAAYAEYEAALTETDMAAKRAAADKAWSDVQQADKLRDAGLFVAAGAVAAGVLDAWLRFPAVHAGPGSAPSPTAEAGEGACGRSLNRFPAFHVACEVRF